ncbi:6-phosphogluconolactonase, cycloisomerase 2 family [Streptomyces zhaozhouensis]|uniref:6-phosphogluconolactonase, cycloisomerase 2 family n=1 Tax=Streptomyces zhaozhouensis TaxID=1300267 RepID=A0A286DSV1_9ACTN|nr:beta-propeller fold lactonase family protein [Streptomyces zhaozhouensis]SOD61728.1 6-phosphogluconolactonase, cycloisomerase 2 family [Streptomyces zhaozhouensis]
MGDRLVCVGSYTGDSGGSGPGLTVLREDTDGTLSTVGETEVSGCSWIAWHPSLPVGYAVNELDMGRVTAFTLDADGTPGVLATLDSGGAAPCHLSVTPDGRRLLVAHYGSGSVAVLALDARGTPTGRTELAELEGSGPDRERQEAPHAHMVTLDATGTLATVVDLGTDTLWSYRLTPEGRLVDRIASRLPAGCGPRQLVRAGGGRAYVLTELTSELIPLTESAPGVFTPHDGVPTSAGPERNYCAQLCLSEDGRLGWASNRGPDTVTVLALDGTTAPRAVAEYPLGAPWPRHFSLAAGGPAGTRMYAASQHGDAVIGLDLDPATGKPTERVRHAVASPAFVAAVPAR